MSENAITKMYMIKIKNYHHSDDVQSNTTMEIVYHQV